MLILEFILLFSFFAGCYFAENIPLCAIFFAIFFGTGLLLGKKVEKR